MTKKEKHKLVFNEAKNLLDQIVKENNISKKDLEKHFVCEAKIGNMRDIAKRLFESLANRNMMASVISFTKREKELKSVLFNYDTSKILETYKNTEDLISIFKKEFNLQNTQSSSLWYKFAKGILSGSSFLSTFKSEKEFDKFVKNFELNKYTKAALPMLLEKEIYGFGFALASDFIKEMGYRDYPKPDIHLIDIFYELKLSGSRNQYDVYKDIIEMSEIVKEDAYTVDKIFWLISSGRFYEINKNVGRNKDKFIKLMKKKLK